MNKEGIRKAIEGRFVDFNGLSEYRKGYENRQDVEPPKSGLWAQIYITHGLRNISSIGSDPCTRRTGVVTIDVFARKGQGTANINNMTDSLEDWFSFYQEGDLWLDAARTINDRGSDTYYQSTVYIPYTCDDYRPTAPNKYELRVLLVSEALQKLVNEALPSALSTINKPHRPRLSGF